jgi:hypothetical protein
MTTHKPEPDGYCTECRTVPCRQNVQQRSVRQLDRIEMKLNRLLRAAGLEES